MLVTMRSQPNHLGVDIVVVVVAVFVNVVVVALFVDIDHIIFTCDQ